MNKPLTPTPMLEPTTQAFIDSLAGGQPIQTLAPAEARAVLSGVQKAAEVPLVDVQIKDVTLPLGPTGSVNIRVVRPAGGTGVLPAIIYMHGGGWVLGDRETHDRLIRELATGANAALGRIQIASRHADGLDAPTVAEQDRDSKAVSRPGDIQCLSLGNHVEGSRRMRVKAREDKRVAERYLFKRAHRGSFRALWSCRFHRPQQRIDADGREVGEGVRHCVGQNDPRPVADRATGVDHVGHVTLALGWIGVNQRFARPGDYF